MFCERRRLHVKPKHDCRCCAFYECDHHPYHVDEITMQRILADCPTQKRKLRQDKPATGKVEWDGLKTTCRRWRWFKGNQAGDPCKDCALPRECRHRGENGRAMLEIAKKRKVKKEGRSFHPAGYYITYHKPGEAEYILHGFSTTNTDHPIIKLLRQRGFKVSRLSESRKRPKYKCLHELLRRPVGEKEWEFVQYCGGKTATYPRAMARRKAGDWEVKLKKVPLPDDLAWTKMGGYKEEVPSDTWTPLHA